MSGFILNRRKFLTGAGLAASALALPGCDAVDGMLAGSSPVRRFMASANSLTYRAQRFLIGADALAPEYSASEIRQGQRPNGSTDPRGEDYLALRAADFTSYRLEIKGMVEKPAGFSVAELRNMPSRTQITRHDCVEGWSCIAKWSGVPLSLLLDEAGVRPEARFVVFHCFDAVSGGLSGDIPYYESLDLVDARHPQTILAYGLNDAVLGVANGAPLRVRVERQLGYKMAKYLKAIELVSDLAPFGNGNGSFWADAGYDWYAGI
ncbi:molybdopterin-dependent oxidoreductase [Pararhizobium sp.]|uniref:molybdopterin-dependent oxidoreductase n=1 Tax=Pararhizobium sp. TaxID=1977563 RepID=UPI00271F4057|nr:molybdopterin-dependent oxidoreductase [Pararhizobium sp.]MDO9418911.1 molybdopterin-dependent oxidoreductase [Pararhizobium sp.]